MKFKKTPTAFLVHMGVLPVYMLKRVCTYRTDAVKQRRRPAQYNMAYQCKNCDHKKPNAGHN